VRSKTLRNYLRLKRFARKAINDETFQVTYLMRDERPVGVDCEVLGQYSEGKTVECIDPRNGVTLKHSFNPRFDYLLHNVIVEPTQGLLYNSDGKFIAESTTWPIYQLYSSFPWKPRRSIKSSIEKNAILVSSNSYGHWIVEDLGSTLYLLEKYPDSTIVVSKTAPKYVLDFLNHLNKEVIFLSGPTLMRNIHWVGKCQDSGWVNPADIDNIRNSQFIKPYLSKENPVKLVYASRRNVKRSPSNEYLLELEMKKAGYEVLQLEKLNFIEEINLLSKTKILTGFHGSAHANSVFMSEGTTLIDLVNENYWTELGHRLANSRNQTYKHLVYSGGLNDSIDIAKVMSFAQVKS
jgi:hypothetical protein